MKMKPTFNKVTKARYQPPVAIVYGTDHYIQFKRFFKTMSAALKCASQFNGFVVSV